jgi:hypothetical protein
MWFAVLTVSFYNSSGNQKLIIVLVSIWYEIASKCRWYCNLDLRLVAGFKVDFGTACDDSCKSAWHGRCWFGWRCTQRHSSWYHIVCSFLCSLSLSLSHSLSLFPFLSFEVDLVFREKVIIISILDICRWGGSCKCTQRCTWQHASRWIGMCQDCCYGSLYLPLEYLNHHWDWLNWVVSLSSEVVGDLLILGRVCRGNTSSPGLERFQAHPDPPCNHIITHPGMVVRSRRFYEVFFSSK